MGRLCTAHTRGVVCEHVHATTTLSPMEAHMEPSNGFIEYGLAAMLGVVGMVALFIWSMINDTVYPN